MFLNKYPYLNYNFWLYKEMLDLRLMSRRCSPDQHDEKNPSNTAVLVSDGSNSITPGETCK